MAAERNDFQKSSVVITGTQKWQSTGIRVTPFETIEVRYVSGKWCFNPEVGQCDADGRWQRAKYGYTYPGGKEGQAIGRIGEELFPLGNRAETPKGLEGELEICMNDDMEGRYGAGFSDNSGEIKFELILHQKQ